jgi:hypothetical protein
MPVIPHIAHFAMCGITGKIRVPHVSPRLRDMGFIFLTRSNPLD